MATAASKKDDSKPEEVDPEVASRRAMGKTDHEGETATPGPAPAAPGTDRDSLLREEKTRAAAARSRGQEADGDNADDTSGESKLGGHGPQGRTATPPNKAKASE